MIRVAVVGLRGYGVIYSGYETFIQFLVSLSDEKKYSYILFCRSRYQQKSIPIKKDSVELINIPSLKGKHLETISYNFMVMLQSFTQKIDIVLYLGTANAYLIFIQKLLGRKTIVNTAGIDWNKKRWSLLGKWYLKLCEKLTVLFADSILCDSQTVRNYYAKKYHLKNLVYIPYGAGVTIRKPNKVLKTFHLSPQRYIYTVGRISPENCFEDVIHAFKKIKTDFKCVIIGDSIYEDDYKKHLLDIAKDDERIIFTGFQVGAAYEELCSNAYAYIETKSIGGTHPSLLEAMAFEKCIIAKDIPENTEVVGDAAYLYSKHNPNSLKDKLKYILAHPKEAKQKSIAAKKRVQQLFDWENIITRYEKCFKNVYESS